MNSDNNSPLGDTGDQKPGDVPIPTVEEIRNAVRRALEFFDPDSPPGALDHRDIAILAHAAAAYAVTLTGGPLEHQAHSAIGMLPCGCVPMPREALEALSDVLLASAYGIGAGIGFTDLHAGQWHTLGLMLAGRLGQTPGQALADFRRRHPWSVPPGAEPEPAAGDPAGPEQPPVAAAEGGEA
jgi:hypothetical protein